MNENYVDKNNKVQLLQTYSLKKVLNVFGSKGKDAAFSEMTQLDKRVVFEPIRIDELTPKEIKRALEILIFLEEKRDGRIKGRTCANAWKYRKKLYAQRRS